MLVLSRKIREAICIGDDIRVIVNDIKGGRVSLSIECPKTMRVIRKEVQDNDDKTQAD